MDLNQVVSPTSFSQLTKITPVKKFGAVIGQSRLYTSGISLFVTNAQIKAEVDQARSIVLEEYLRCIFQKELQERIDVVQKTAFEEGMTKAVIAATIIDPDILGFAAISGQDALIKIEEGQKLIEKGQRKIIKSQKVLDAAMILGFAGDNI